MKVNFSRLYLLAFVPRSRSHFNPSYLNVTSPSLSIMMILKGQARGKDVESSGAAAAHGHTITRTAAAVAAHRRDSRGVRCVQEGGESFSFC